MADEKNRAQAESFLELARLHFSKCDFEPAIAKAKEAAVIFQAEKEVSSYLQCQNMLLRMYAEQDRQDDINATK